MKNLILVVIGSVLLTGCGVITNTQNILNVHPAAQPYVSRFEKVSGSHIDNLEVVFRPIDGNVIGYCQKSFETKTSDLGFKKTEITHVLIVLDSTYWDPNYSLENYSEVINPVSHLSPRQIESANREELLWHELGHCILNRPHTDSTASIMFPYHLGGSNYLSYYDGYVSELFGMTSYAGSVIKNDTYASKVFPEFVDRGDEIQLLSANELENGDFHETHVETVVPDSQDQATAPEQN